VTQLVGHEVSQVVRTNHRDQKNKSYEYKLT